MEETKHLIGVHVDQDNNIVSFRIAGYPSFSLVDLPKDRIIAQCENRKIYGLTVSNGEILESDEELKKYGIIKNNEIEQFALTVVSNIQDRGNCIFATNGIHKNFRTPDVIKLFSSAEFSNAEMYKDSSGYIIKPLKDNFVKVD